MDSFDLTFSKSMLLNNNTPSQGEAKRGKHAVIIQSESNPNISLFFIIIFKGKLVFGAESIN